LGTRPPRIPPRQQCLPQTDSVPPRQVAAPPARGPQARGEGPGALDELGQPRTRSEAAEVAGEDGELARRVAPVVEQTHTWCADPEKTVGVRSGQGQDRRAKQLAPVRCREDGHRQDEDTQSAVRDGLLHSCPHEGRRRERVDDLAVRCPASGHRLCAQSSTLRASTASAQGSRNLLQKRGVRSLATDANASTVTRRQPASAAAAQIARHSVPSTAGPRTASTLASWPMSEPPREASSMPSATRTRQGTCQGKQSTFPPAAQAARDSCRAQRCIWGDCVLPLRNAAIAAAASLLRMQ
jgi:hypothetical protein